jgi:hypothetical protein
MPSSNGFGLDEQLCADKLRSRSCSSIEVKETCNEPVHSSISIDDDEDTEDGEIADDINEENGVAQGLEYERELGEATDDTMVEVLVMRIKNDMKLTRC